MLLMTHSDSCPYVSIVAATVAVVAELRLPLTRDPMVPAGASGGGGEEKVTTGMRHVEVGTMSGQ